MYVLDLETNRSRVEQHLRRCRIDSVVDGAGDASRNHYPADNHDDTDVLRNSDLGTTRFDFAYVDSSQPNYPTLPKRKEIDSG